MLIDNWLTLQIQQKYESPSEDLIMVSLFIQFLFKSIILIFFFLY